MALPGISKPPFKKTWNVGVISNGAGSLIADGITVQGNPANVFDGNFDQQYYEGWRFNGSAIVGKDFGSPKYPRRLYVARSNYGAWNLDSPTNVAIQLFCSNSWPTSQTDGAVLINSGWFPYTDGHKDFYLSPGLTPAYRYWWVRVFSESGEGSISIAEVHLEEWI